MALPTAILAFLATFLLAAVAVWIARLVMDRVSPPDIEDEDEVSAPNPSFLDGSPIVADQEVLSSISVFAWLLAKLNLVEHLRFTLGQAELGWTVGRLTACILLTAAVSWALLRNIPWLPAWGLVALSMLCAAIPYLYVRNRMRKRWRQIEEQLPDMLESLSRAMRAGYAFGGAFANVASQAANPLGRELRKTYGEGELGIPWDRALENLTERLPLQEICLFVAAVQMQNKSGGNISEVLDKLAENMREGAALKGEVHSLTSQGRFAGYILTSLPFAIAGVMMFVNPTFLDPLFQEEIGKTLVVGSILSVVAAHLIIQKLVDIKL